MRLTPHQHIVLKNTALQCFNSDAELRLFGSRVRDDLKGGDMDLLINTSMTHSDAIAKAHLAFLTLVYAQLGEQKIDVLIDYPTRQNKPTTFNVAKQRTYCFGRRYTFLDAWRQCRHHLYHLNHAMTSLAAKLPVTISNVAKFEDETVQEWVQFYALLNCKILWVQELMPLY